MPRSKALYDQIQYDLVVRSEKAHEFGLRHKATSGDICNRILIDFLRSEFPPFRFNPGTITAAEKRPLRYEHSSADLSRQIDIIASMGSPFDQMYEYVVAPLRNVKLTIETKKWIQPKGLEGEQKKLQEISKFTRKTVLLVAFRHDGDFSELRKKCAAASLFAFSTRSIGYPEDDTTFRSNCLHTGELLRLCATVDDLLLA